MDFNTLSRKDLQTLCKKNKIPANITSVAMVAALAALPQVEGLDEILNPREGDIGTPSIQIRSASRTTTQRKAMKEPESSKVSTRPSRATRTRVAEGVVEQENKDANVPATPAMVPSSRRRVPAVSTRRKKEVVEDGDDGKDGVQEKPKDVPKTPAVAPSSRKRVIGRSVCNKNEPPSGTSVQKGYSTRRSVKLLGKSLSEMNLVETEDVGLDKKTDDVSEELSDVSQNVEDSSNTEMGASMQTVSTVVSESMDESDVSSLNKNDNEGQSHDLGSEEKLVSGKASDVVDELQAEPQEEGLGKVNHVDAEPNDSCLDLQENFDECGDSNETGSELFPELEDSGDSGKLENKECDETKQDAISFEACEEASMEIADNKDVSSAEEVLENVADNANHIENFEPMHDDIDECGDSNEAGSELLPELEDSGDSGKLENKECDETKQNAISFEACEEASMEIADNKDVSSAEEVLENVSDNANPNENFERMHDDIDECGDSNEAGSELLPELGGSGDSAKLENKGCYETKQDAISFEACEEASMKIADNKDVSITEVVLENVADGNVNHIENLEPVHDGVDESADNKDVLSAECVLEKDSSSSEDRQEDATLQLSLLREDQIAEDHMSEKLEAEESEVAAGEDDTVIVDGSSETSVVAESEKLEAEESEAAAGEDATVIVDGNSFSHVADGTEMSFDNNQQVESNGISNPLVEADGDTNGSSETMAVAQLNEKEISDVAIEPVLSESLCTVQSEETKEIQTVTNIMKENLIIDFQKMSIRGLKKKLKELDAKPKSMTDNDAATCMQGGERKRTALQALPPNQLTTGEAHSDV